MRYLYNEIGMDSFYEFKWIQDFTEMKIYKYSYFIRNSKSKCF